MPGTDNSSAVSVRDLERRFGDFVAVNRISFDVARGEIFGFLGSNGSGKSTTIRMLCGILEPTGGTGTVAGFDLHSQREEIKKHIGYMSQKFSLYEDLTVQENIDFYAGIYRVPDGKRQERKEWALEMAGLRNHRRKRTGVLSGGWKQRLALGCAVLHEPRIVFLDEPTSGVDPASRRLFWDLIYELVGQGVTVFVTTHYMDEAEYCDRIALIHRGEFIATGTPATLKQDFMREEVLEVTCEAPQDVLEELVDLPDLRDVALFGNRLHVTVEDLDHGIATIRETLELRGDQTARIERIVPSLEDVFVSLIEAQDQTTGGQSEAA